MKVKLKNTIRLFEKKNIATVFPYFAQVSEVQLEPSRTLNLVKI